jgi:hypothetical protein
MKRMLAVVVTTVMGMIGVVAVGETTAVSPSAAAATKAAACYPPKVRTSVSVAHRNRVRVRHRAVLTITVRPRSGTARPTGRVLVKVKRPGVRFSTERLVRGGSVRLSYNVGRKRGRLLFTVSYRSTACSAFKPSAASGSIRLVR